MDSNNITIVKTYLRGIVSNDWANLPIDPKLKHESPFGIIEGSRAFIEACKTIVADTNDIVIKSEIEQDNKVCIEYDALTPTRNFSITEWFTIENNLITEIKAYFDSSEYNS